MSSSMMCTCEQTLPADLELKCDSECKDVLPSEDHSRSYTLA